MAKPLVQNPAQLSLLRPLPDRKEDLLTRLVLSNRILTAEPIPTSQAVSPGRYRLTVSIAVPGQWSCSEIQRVLEITQDWGWGGVLDLGRLREIEQLLDAVAGGVAS